MMRDLRSLPAANATLPVPGYQHVRPNGRHDLDTRPGAATGRHPVQRALRTVGQALRAFVAMGKEIRLSPLWQRAFAGRRKDHRYYNIVEDTMHPEITHRYLMITDQHGHAGTVQPFFVTSIDMTEGLNGAAKSWVEAVRRVWSGFLRTRVLMVGCVAGEGVLDGDASWQKRCIPVFKNALVEQAYKLGAGLIVFKEFRAAHRAALDRPADGRVRPCPEHADDEAEFRLRIVRRIHVEEARLRHQKEPAPQVQGDRERRRRSS